MHLLIVLSLTCLHTSYTQVLQSTGDGSSAGDASGAGLDRPDVVGSETLVSEEEEATYGVQV